MREMECIQKIAIKKVGGGGGIASLDRCALIFVLAILIALKMCLGKMFEKDFFFFFSPNMVVDYTVTLDTVLES